MVNIELSNAQNPNGSTPTEESIVPRERTFSFKRKREGESYKNKTFDNFVSITGVISNIRSELDKQSTSKTGTKSTNEKFLSPISSAISELESKLTDLAGMFFDLASDHDELKHSVFEMQNTIKSNKVSGDLVSNTEQSATYKGLCEEVEKSMVTSKIQNLDLGCQKSGTHSEMTEAVKSKLKEFQPPIPLRDVVITPLSKSTIIKDEKHLIPILLKTKNRDQKFNLDTTLKANDLNPSFHWPKDLVPMIKDMRKKLGEFKNDELELATKQIMIRPAQSGKTLTISYRPLTPGAKWTFLENVKIPATNDFLLKTGFSQPCISKYFKL